MRYLNSLSLKYKKILTQSNSFEDEPVIIEKQKQFVVKEVKKPKSNMKKKVALFLAEVALLAGLSNSYNVNSMPLNEETFELSQSTDYSLQDKVSIDNILVETDNTNTNNIKLGDLIILKEESLVYVNSYDAFSGENGLNRYYKDNIDRYVAGLTFSLNGELTTVYLNDQDAEYLVCELENNGAIITSVLLGNEYGLEGYSRVCDVIVKGYLR